MNDFRKRLVELNTEVSDRYTELKKLKSEYIFLTEEEIENGEFDMYFEVRNSNGYTYDAFIVKVNEKGIEIIESEDDDRRYYISLMDLADVSDRIALVDLMENQIK
jgi:hypothetical protein